MLIFRNRNLPQSYRSDEEGKEKFFHGISQRDSARNIPPLDFPEDSDRTVSLDSETDNLKLLSDPGENENIFKRSFWKLTPLSEKYEEKTENGTASELSSLPEDNGARHEPEKSANDSLSGEKTDLSVYPTYSLHKRLGAEGEVASIEKINTDLGTSVWDGTSGLGCSETRTGIYFSGFFPTGSRCKSYESDIHEEEKNDESCSECEFHKSCLNKNSLLRDEDGPMGRHLSPNVSLVSSPSLCPAVTLEDYHSNRSCRNKNVDSLGNTAASEIDENTFSLKHN